MECWSCEEGFTAASRRMNETDTVLLTPCGRILAAPCVRGFVTFPLKMRAPETPGARCTCSLHLRMLIASSVTLTGLRFQLEHELKLILMVSADCKPTSGSRLRRSSESSIMDCHDSKLNGAVFGMRDWLNYLRDQAATYRKLVERAVDPLVKTELRALASVCEEIADNIEDHLTGGEDQAPRGPLSRLS
jgi:hypothetical protein